MSNKKTKKWTFDVPFHYVTVTVNAKSKREANKKLLEKLDEKSASKYVDKKNISLDWKSPF